MSIDNQVGSRVVSLPAHTKASTVQAVNALSERMKEVAAHIEEQTSHIVGAVDQQLEKEIEAVVVSTIVMSEKHT